MNYSASTAHSNKETVMNMLIFAVLLVIATVIGALIGARYALIKDQKRGWGGRVLVWYKVRSSVGGLLDEYREIDTEDAWIFDPAVHAGVYGYVLTDIAPGRLPLIHSISDAVRQSKHPAYTQRWDHSKDEATLLFTEPFVFEKDGSCVLVLTVRVNEYDVNAYRIRVKPRAFE